MFILRPETNPHHQNKTQAFLGYFRSIYVHDYGTILGGALNLTTQ